jgi:hypothetical protein
MPHIRRRSRSEGGNGSQTYRSTHDAQVGLVERDTEAFDLAVERGDFHAQQLGGTALVAASALERVADQLALVTLNFFL